MQEAKNEAGSQSSWNLSARKIQLIGDLMNRAISESLGMVRRPEGFLQGYCDHRKAYQMWRQIASLIRNQLKPEEVKKMGWIEKWVHKKCLRRNPEYDEVEGQSSKYYYPQVLMRKYTPRYINFVNFLLRRHGMDISSRNLDLEEID